MDENTVVNAAPYIGVISQIIMWGGLIFCLGMIKGFISQGASLAIAEFLVRPGSEDVREKVCRWLGDKDRIMDVLERIDEQNSRK